MGFSEFYVPELSGGFLRDATGTYFTPFILAGVLAFLALILVVINNPPEKKMA